jgi:hypothetical protein
MTFRERASELRNACREGAAFLLRTALFGGCVSLLALVHEAEADSLDGWRTLIWLLGGVAALVLWRVPDRPSQACATMLLCVPLATLGHGAWSILQWTLIGMLLTLGVTQVWRPRRKDRRCE